MCRTGSHAGTSPWEARPRRDGLLDSRAPGNGSLLRVVASNFRNIFLVEVFSSGELVRIPSPVGTTDDGKYVVALSRGRPKVPALFLGRRCCVSIHSVGPTSKNVVMSQTSPVKQTNPQGWNNASFRRLSGCLNRAPTWYQAPQRLSEPQMDALKRNDSRPSQPGL